MQPLAPVELATTLRASEPESAKRERLGAPYVVLWALAEEQQRTCQRVDAAFGKALDAGRTSTGHRRPVAGTELEPIGADFGEAEPLLGSEALLFTLQRTAEGEGAT